MPDIAETTRYERFLEILDRAAGTSEARYGGAGPFWHRPLDELLTLKVHGVRMIAPAAAAKMSCCADHEPAASDSATGRGDASGLVRGLRGQAPFDGSLFPPLPWGGQRVPEEEISFIAGWIDDGLPPDDREVASFDVEGDVTMVDDCCDTDTEPRAEVHEHEVFEGSPNEYKFQYGELKQRVNLDCMPPSQLAELRAAFRELYRLNKWPEDRRSYNNIALVHQNHCQHGWERFLPWHRIYLYEFEQALQDVMPGVAMPYWDFTMPQYRPEDPAKGCVIPKAYKAFLTNDSLDYLTGAVPCISDSDAGLLREQMVDKKTLYNSPSDFFKAVVAITGNKDYAIGEHRNRFVDALLASNALWYPLRYPNQYHGKTIEDAVHYHYPTAADIEQIMSLRTFRDFGGGSFYNDSFGFLDQNPHNTMHLWTGGMNPNPSSADKKTDALEDATKVMRALNNNRNRGVQIKDRRFHTSEDMYTRPDFGDMFSNLTASFDPVFWPIHVNIDRLWAEWQERNPHSLPQDLHSVLTPWSYTTADTLDHRRFGYEYVRCAYLVPVGLDAPVGRFVSKPIDIPEPARSFRQAEVRLHRVPQLPRSCFIRVFINLPDANASTPLDDEHYAGYLAIFGHGPCYGGPGHCDLPPSQPRGYDLRPRHHNTPRNHRVNVTDTARKLLENGATSLQLTLVVLGADYREETELLRLDGVSLDFFD
jgi:tyrosinase